MDKVDQGTALDWLNTVFGENKLTQEALKFKACNFFGEDVIMHINKRTVWKKFSNFKKTFKNEKTRIVRLIRKNNNGSGKDFKNPPNDFAVHIVDPKDRGQEFELQCQNQFEEHIEYENWRKKPLNIFPIEKKAKLTQTEDFQYDDKDNCLKLIKNDNLAPNIYETEKNILVEGSNGLVHHKKVRENYAKITVRKRKRVDQENLDPSLHRKRTMNVDNILNFVNEDNLDDKAKMLARIIDKEGPEFGKKVKLASKALQENESLSVSDTHALMVGTKTSGYAWRQIRTASIKSIGYSPLASEKRVRKYQQECFSINKDDWVCTPKSLFKHKHGKNMEKSMEIPVLMVKNLSEYILKIAQSEAEELDTSSGKIHICFNADAGGGRFVSNFGFLNRKDQKIVLHPYLIFEGSDCRKNLEITMGEFTESIRKLQGSKIFLNGQEISVELFGLFDLAALNYVVGKQSHSASYPCAWTDVSKSHLKSENHKHTAHTQNSCSEIRFLTIEDYEETFAIHANKKQNADLSKTGKDFGSIVTHNILPLISVFRYVPPLMHLIMGESNRLLNELKEITKKADSENALVNDNENQAQQEIDNMYNEMESMEKDWANLNFAHLVVLNDIKRFKLLIDGKEKEASTVEIEHFDKKMKKKSNKKVQCDGDLCLLFSNDEIMELDTMITCKNGCDIHLRCEGLPIIEGLVSIQDFFECYKCKSGTQNHEWLGCSLENIARQLSDTKCSLSNKITAKKADIVKQENFEEDYTGPRQKMLKEAMKVLGDQARFHGGDLQGKQVQKLLDNARDNSYEILECISDMKPLHQVFKNGIEILANISDSLRLPLEEFDEDDINMIKKTCEKWGEYWPKAFPHKNISPKGHIISIVLPKSVEYLRSFYRFYKLEQKGEEIHSELNDLERKAWVIRNKEQKLWTIIQRYEVRNQSKVDIVEPVKRLFKNPTRMFGFV